MTKTPQASPETKGRKYSFTAYGLLSRRVGTETWFGRQNYKTEAEARQAFNDALKPQRYQNVGGITVDFGAAGNEMYERKLTRIECSAEVLEVAITPM